MRVAITGAYGSGKTTLVRAFARERGLAVEPVQAMQDPWGSPPKAATACTGPELVELTVRRLLDRVAAESSTADSVSDGSLVHDWVFAKTLLLHGSRADHREPPSRLQQDEVNDLLRPVRLAVRSRLAARYDVVAYLPISFAMTEPAPPVSEQFRVLSDRYLLEELAAAGIGPITVTGTPAERVARLVEATAPAVLV